MGLILGVLAIVAGIGGIQYSIMAVVAGITLVLAFFGLKRD